MTDSIIHALVLIQNWGESGDIVATLESDRHIVSIYHIMGRYSYLIDANFDSKEQLSGWVNRMKSIKLASGTPAIISMQTQRIIDVHKKKDDYSLGDYLALDQRYHFFVKIDNPHHDDALLKLLTKSPIVYSVLHVQGENSFTIEVIVSDYDEYRKLLNEMKQLKTIHHIETQEVISVVKYRNQVIGAGGQPVTKDTDIRELYTL
ncbi:MAG: Lrp/AsnC family transcriptional regulator [Spirochaetes bacterium]|nr:Lrp/AsnC family transcriptional regulator [Spirochaetota bacterium]